MTKQQTAELAAPVDADLIRHNGSRIVVRVLAVALAVFVLGAVVGPYV